MRALRPPKAPSRSNRAKFTTKLQVAKEAARKQHFKQYRADLEDKRYGHVEMDDYRVQVHNFVNSIGENECIGGLNLGQTRLVKAFFALEGDIEAAAVICGFKEREAEILFADPRVQREILIQRQALEEATKLSEVWIVKRLMRMADAPRLLSRFKKIASDGSLYWDFRGASREELALISDMSTSVYTDSKNGKIVKSFKVKLPDSKAALDTLARIQGAYKDVKAVDKLGDSFIELLQAGRDRVRGQVDQVMIETEPL